MAAQYNDMKKMLDLTTKNLQTVRMPCTKRLQASKSILNNYKYLEEVKKKALEKLKYENADIDSLIYEFLERIEVNKTDDNDYISLRVILNTGNNYGITFRHDEHPFCTDYTYDKSRGGEYI